jgi:hypothetical protein
MDAQTRERLDVLETFSKALAICLALLYVVGFVVVSSYLLRFGVSSFSVLQLQYLIAGVWVLGPPILYTWLVDSQQQFEVTVAPENSGLNLRRFFYAFVLTGVPTGIALLLIVSIPHLLEGLTWGIGLRFTAFYLATSTAAHLYWKARTAPDEQRTIWKNRTHAARFFLTLLVMLTLGYAVWFSVRIYPLIPFSLGGGRPLTIQFIEGEKGMPDAIQRADTGSKRSISYQLLFSTDHYYVVLSPLASETSMEISRESVAGIIVLK